MSKSKFIATGIIGNILEYYDIALYGFLAPKMASLFFPAKDPVLITIASLGTFAVGFLMRPLGGAFFGHIGDRFGRKKALLLSMLLTAIPTLIIGCLPTYAAVGIIAPICLIFCRLIQGLCIGGESAGIIVYNLENAPKDKINFIGGLLCSASFIGSILGAIASAIFSIENMPYWSWRVPFWLGGILAVYTLYLRLTITESTAFIRTKEPVARIPFFEILKHAKKNFICIVGLGATCSIAYHLLVIYTNSILINRLHLSLAMVLAHNIVLLGFLVVLLPLMGLCADKVGNSRLMKWSVIGIAFISYPYFWSLEHTAIECILLFQIIFVFIYSGFLGPMSAYLIGLFSVHTRYSGIAIGYNLGNTLFGGTSPLIAALLTYWTSSQVAPAFYLFIACLAGWLAIYFVNVTKPFSGATTTA